MHEKSWWENWSEIFDSLRFFGKLRYTIGTGQRHTTTQKEIPFLPCSNINNRFPVAITTILNINGTSQKEFSWTMKKERNKLTLQWFLLCTKKWRFPRKNHTRDTSISWVCWRRWWQQSVQRNKHALQATTRPPHTGRKEATKSKPVIYLPFNYFTTPAERYYICKPPLYLKISGDLFRIMLISLCPKFIQFM